MEEREEERLNDLFFVCSLIEYVARQTKNERKVIVKAMGHEGITHYLDLAEVYHCENIDKVTEEIINKYHIAEGCYDNVAKAKDSIPTFWDMGKVLYRLIYEKAKRENISFVDSLFAVYDSWIMRKIDDYNCSMYYENTSYQYASLVAGHAL